jgi:hypothetical protein
MSYMGLGWAELGLKTEAGQSMAGPNNRGLGQNTEAGLDRGWTEVRGWAG